MRKTAIIFTIALTGLMSCTGNFEKINTNPNTITYGQIKAYNMTEPLLYGTSRIIQNYSHYYDNELMQVTAHSATVTNAVHQYLITESYFQSIWNNIARYGADAAHMCDLAKNDGDKYLEAVGLIVKAFNLCNLTALYGDIPYEEAYQGQEGVLTPKFNSQKEVIDLMIDDLEQANKILADSPAPRKSKLDPIYNDNPAQWRKFANSLKIRLLCRMTNMGDEYWNRIQEMLNYPKMYPIFESNADNAFCSFQAVDPYKSYWGYAVFPDADFIKKRLAENFITLTINQDEGHTLFATDPRMKIWGLRRGDYWYGARSGAPNEILLHDDVNAANQNATVLNSATMPAFWMDYSELLFIFAEGAYKGKLTLPKGWQDYYDMALSASCAKWSEIGKTFGIYMTDSEINAWKASALASASLVGAALSPYGTVEELILGQKYLSNFYVFFEQYNDWRRTEYPVLTIGDGTVFNQHELPTRFVYPNYTCLSNASNVRSALDRMGGENDMHLALDWSWKAVNNGTHRNPYTSSNE